MNDKKQIEEMAREMCHLSAECKTCQICDDKYHGDGEPCYFQCMAREIINHGYRKLSDLTPCDVCRFNPPSSGDGKPCHVCPAQAKGGNVE